VVAAIVVTAAFALTSCDWLMAGYNAGHANDNMFDRTITVDNVSTLARRWQVPKAWSFDEQPVVVGDTVYVFDGHNDGGANPSWSDLAVEALDAETGAPRWSVPLTNPIGGSYPTSLAVSGSTLVVGVGRELRAFDTTDASLRWQTAVTDGTPTSTLVVGADVYFGPQRIDIATGRVRVSLRDPRESVIAASGGQVYLLGVPATACIDQPIVALDASTGELRWTSALAGGNTAVQGAVVDGVLFVSTYHCPGGPFQRYGVQAFDEATGATLWSARTDWLLGSAGHQLLTPGDFADAENPLGSRIGYRARRPLDGTTTWPEQVAGCGADTVVTATATSGPVIFSTWTGQLCANDAVTGAELGRWSVPGSGSVIAANGCVYVQGSGPGADDDLLSAWCVATDHDG
jgi:outer membrane protein assembly factor BamB